MSRPHERPTEAPLYNSGPATTWALPGPAPGGPHPAACSAWQPSFVASRQHSQPPAPTGVRARAAFRRPGFISPAETEQEALSSGQVAGLRAQWGLGLWPGSRGLSFSWASHLKGFGHYSCGAVLVIPCLRWTGPGSQRRPPGRYESTRTRSWRQRAK